MRLGEFLRSYLPRADRRCRIAPALGISLLLKNVLLSREPLYGSGEWVAKDGAVPLYFQVASGNVADDQTHRATWDLLCRLTGRRDFLYVADCKLASTENMAHIHQRQGRFLTVLPRTRSEDSAFRELLG